MQQLEKRPVGEMLGKEDCPFATAERRRPPDGLAALFLGHQFDPVLTATVTSEGGVCMPGPFCLYSPEESLELPDRPVVAVTGAAGRIGTQFAKAACNEFKLILIDRPETEPEVPEECDATVRCADVTNPAEIEPALSGADVVVHLAADPSPSAGWDELLPVNIEGTFNTVMSAQRAGCKRLIFASSIHAVSGYREERQVHVEDPVNPGDLYGVSKCFGEALGRYVAEQLDMSFIAVRIAGFQPRERMQQPESYRLMNSFVSHRDLTQLLIRAVKAPHIRFAIFHGASGNRFNRLDISLAEELLGYSPLDDATDENPELADLELRKWVRPHNESERTG